VGWAPTLHEYHDARAQAHRQAMWQPWIVIDETELALGTASPQTFTIVDGLIATMFVALSAVRLIDRTRLASRIRALEELERNRNLQQMTPP
jgi:hypothetical protein